MRLCQLLAVVNADVLEDGELVLIDSGAEFEGYAGDITRTFPVNGRFSKEQKTVYEIVLASQLAAIDAVKPGNHWNDPHDAAIKVLTQGLKDLGVLKGSRITCTQQDIGLVRMCMMLVSIKLMEIFACSNLAWCSL